jgi:hypothetical protein
MENAKHIIPTQRELETRLDELRVKLHLGGMEAREKFDALRHDVTALGRKAAQTSKEGLGKLIERIEELESHLIVRD